jgi:glycosyltransferase involved in cell wall biosynthesis
LVEGGCGLLVPPGDAQALSKAMSYVLESPKARKSMGGASARRAVERFDLRVVTEAYEVLYKELIEGRVGPPHPRPLRIGTDGLQDKLRAFWSG